MDRLFRSTIDCLATVEELDEFGIGIGLYFRSLKQFGVIFLLMGFINILASSQNYEYNPDDTEWTGCGRNV